MLVKRNTGHDGRLAWLPYS